MRRKTTREGSEPYEIIENFFKNELSKYDNYVIENAKSIIKEAVKGDVYGYKSLPILDKTNIVEWFSGSWADPMKQDKYRIDIVCGKLSVGVIVEWEIEKDISK